MLLVRRQITAALMCRRKASAARLQALANDADQMLCAQAQLQGRLDRELGELQALITDLSPAPAALTARARTLEHALKALQVNPAIARHYPQSLVAR